MTSKPEIIAPIFRLAHILRGYFHEDVADEYGTPPRPPTNSARTPKPTSVSRRREWQQLAELTPRSRCTECGLEELAAPFA